MTPPETARPAAAADIKIYFVAGETSGDNHGASLMAALRRLRPDVQFVGRGGPCMACTAGGHFQNWTESAGIVGLWEVLKQYGYFRREFHKTLHEIEAARPSAIVLIDYPGFNLRLAKALRRRLPAVKIIYYISPQVWAWNRGRIPRMAKWLDLMLCIFPFEKQLYETSGLRTVFIGHPMIETLRGRKIDAGRDAQLIGFFPGSRRREVARLFPLMLEVAHELLKTRPDLSFEVAAASDTLASMIRAELSRSTSNAERFVVGTGQSASLMQRCLAGVVASGTATLEAAYFRMPFVLVYKVSWITYFVGRLLISVKYLGMPNVLANRQVVTEFVQHQATCANVSKAMAELIENAGKREAMVSEFDQIIAQLGEGGASEKAARAVLEMLGEHTPVNAEPVRSSR